jgi:glycosyltransferase involved in cell wall biosynthesis
MYIIVPMISVVITSLKEPKTIGKCIKCIADRKYSGITAPFEIIQVSPDDYA